MRWAGAAGVALALALGTCAPGPTSAHLVHQGGPAPNVASGQTIRRGGVIGYEGSTGFSTGPHLHFEIRYNGGYVDPLAYLR